MLAITPLLTRLYTPDEFGAFAVYSSVLLVGASIATLRYDFARPLTTEEATAAALLVLAVAAVCLTGCVVAVATAVIGDDFVRLADVAALEPYLWLIPVGVFGAGLYQALTYWSIRDRAFGRIARTRVAQAVAMGATQTLAGVASAGVVGLLIGALLGQVAGVGRLGAAAGRELRETGSALTLEKLRGTARRYRRFPLLSLPSGLTNSLGLYGPAILVAAFYGPVTAGWFALTQRALNAPTALLSNSVGQAYTGEAASLARTGSGSMLALFDSTLRRLALIALVPTLLAVAVSPALFEFVFGSEWRPSGEFAQVLAAMFFVQFVVVPLSQSLNILERLGLQLAYDNLRLVLALGGLTLAYLAGADALGAVAAYGGGMTIAYLANVLINRQAVKRVVHCPI
jgi:O-antigen/teichoic acid export membrane protein